MTRIHLVAALAIGSLFLAVPQTSFAAHCESIQAKCAVAIGGACDPVVSHWMYGPSHGLGGTTAAFNACLARHGAAPPATVHARPLSGENKCISDQGRCAIEAGGYCNRRTGFWCVGARGNGGRAGNRYCNGTMMAFLTCLDRVRDGRK